MKYKIIAMDFDGTLLTKNKNITQKTIETLSEYKKNGYIIVGVTARSLSSVQNICDIEMFNHLILNNGAYIYNVKNSQGKHINYIKRETAEKLTNYFKDIAEKIEYCATEKYYTYKLETKNLNKHYWMQINKFEELTEQIARMNIFAENIEKLLEYKTYIDGNYEDIDSFVMQETDNPNHRKWISLNTKGMNKAVTLEKLCNELNINMNEVIFFGDGPNDIEIIKKVGMGVAMGNAIPQVKENAKKITLSNDEDGIAVFLKNIN